MKEVIVRLTSDHIKVKGGEYVQDLVRCGECRNRNERCGMGEHRWCEMLNMSTTPDDFCSYGEVRDE